PPGGRFTGRSHRRQQYQLRGSLRAGQLPLHAGSFVLRHDDGDFHCSGPLGSVGQGTHPDECDFVPYHRSEDNGDIWLEPPESAIHATPPDTALEGGSQIEYSVDWATIQASYDYHGLSARLSILIQTYQSP